MLNIKKLAQSVAVFFALLAIVFVSAVLTMKVVTSGRTVQVPDVSGREITDAINTLKEAGLEIKVDREEFNPTAAQGTVVSQTPAPGSSVKKGRNISVVVSLGRQEITVPDLHGETFRRAQIMLRQAGLSLGEVARVCSPEPREAVISQDPSPQYVVQRGGLLDLLVSNGPPPTKYITPDLSGRTLSDATGVARQIEAGLMPTGKSGVVTSQDPLAGYPMFAGDIIKVTLGSVAPAVPHARPAQKPDAAPAKAPVTAPQARPAPPSAPPAAPPVQKPAPAPAEAAPGSAQDAVMTAPPPKPVPPPAKQIIRDPLGATH